MSTHYLGITALQEPFDLGALDDAGRLQVVFNVLAWKRPSDTFVEEVLGILSAASITNAVATSKGEIPRTGSWISVMATGGTAPIGTHNDGTVAYRRPGAQLIAHAASWAAANGLAQAAFSALVAVRNEDVA